MISALCCTAVRPVLALLGPANGNAQRPLIGVKLTRRLGASDFRV